MGIFKKIFGEKKPKNTKPAVTPSTVVFPSLASTQDRRNDPGCPLNVAKINMSGYGGGTSFGIITKNPNHPVCQVCTRRNEKACF